MRFSKSISHRICRIFRTLSQTFRQIRITPCGCTQQSSVILRLSILLYLPQFCLILFFLIIITAFDSLKFISFVDPATPYTFDNTTTVYPAHSLKFNLRIANWPFKNVHNSLQAVITTVANSQSPSSRACSVSQKDLGGGLAWMEIILNGVVVYLFLICTFYFKFIYSLYILSLTVVCYGVFDTASIIDGQSRSIQFLENEDQSVSAILPHFWNYAGEYYFIIIISFFPPYF
jgi:hypothetical protein